MAFQSNQRDMWKYGLTRREYDIFFMILGTMEYENWVDISPSTIAGELSMKVTHVHAAFRSLARKQVLAKVPTAGGVMRYRVNPQIAWRGSAKTYAKHGYKLAPVVPLHRTANGV